jgi:uncharacterized protein DUF2652
MGMERGCLLLADIGGYTKYLTGVELEHSQDILADLLSVVVKQLSGLAQLAKLEGDAVFCVAPADPEDPPVTGSAFVTLVEGCYFAFEERLRDIAHATSCRCDACRTIPALALKFLVHHGEWVTHEVVGQRELVGPDVILAHRLLKNTVFERTGLRGYALFSWACLQGLGLDPELIGMTPHEETYDDVGLVPCFVHDLEARWREEQERSSVYLGPGEALIDIEGDLPGTPPIVWETFMDPEKRLVWQQYMGVTGFDQDNPRGTPGVGTTNHCMHGDGAVVREHILDWKPYRYMSDRSTGPFGSLLCTIEFSAGPSDETTHVAYRMQPEGDEGQLAAFAPMAPMFEQMLQGGFAQIAAMLREADAAVAPEPADLPS